MDSWKAPSAIAPSPKKQAVTRRRPCILSARRGPRPAAGRRRRSHCRRRSAAPRRTGASSRRARASSPPALPNISAMIASIGTARAPARGRARGRWRPRLSSARARAATPRRPPPRRCRGAGNRGSSAGRRARRTLLHAPDAHHVGQQMARLSQRTARWVRRARPRTRVRTRICTARLAPGRSHSCATLQRGGVAFGQAEFAGLEQPAHDLAAARARQRWQEVDLLGRHRRAEPLAGVPMQLQRSASSAVARLERLTKAFTTSPTIGSGLPITPASATAGCSISTLSTSNGPIRWPADLITSSARPTNQ
jgi:hypothetical protein